MGEKTHSGAAAAEPGLEARRIANRLREALLERGVDQRAVESRLGCHHGQLASLLDGASPLRLDQLLAILDAAGIPQAEFFAAVYHLPNPQRQARPRSDLAGIPMESWLHVLRVLRTRLAENGAVSAGSAASAPSRVGRSGGGVLPAAQLGAQPADDAEGGARLGLLQQDE